MTRYRFNTYGRRAFAAAGPSAWNSFSDYLRASDCSVDSFKHLLKTYLIITFILHNQIQNAKSIPNCDVSFANGELHQACGHVTAGGRCLTVCHADITGGLCRRTAAFKGQTILLKRRQRARSLLTWFRRRGLSSWRSGFDSFDQKRVIKRRRGAEPTANRICLL